MRAPSNSFAICLDNMGYGASLIPGQVYRVLPDARAAKDGLVRVVDESGEDYLFDKKHFAPPALRAEPD